MPNISGDTFEELNRYVSVRLQQGVPLVDADWNEMDDIRRYELRRLIKWCIGNGVPDGNDGFHIKPTTPTSPNDFIITGGDGTAEKAGRCLVEGWDVINPKDLNYTKQVPAPAALTTPEENTTRTDIVYLDVWEREVTAQEETTPPLINPLIGIETCVRYKLEWVVRVQENCPDPGALPPPPTGHAFYPLAKLIRQGETIDRNMIFELRNTGLSLSGLKAEIKDARGDKPTLSSRLEASLSADGHLLQNVVGTDQLAPGSVTEEKLDRFARARMHKVPLLRYSLLGRNTTITSVNTPYCIAFDGTHMWTGNFDNNCVCKIDITTNTVVATISVGLRAVGIAFDGTHIWVINNNSRSISKIDIVNNSVIATVILIHSPTSIAFDGTNIWVVNDYGYSVSKIDIVTNSIVADVVLHDYPGEVYSGDGYPANIAYGGSYIWVADFMYEGGTIKKIDIITNSVVSTIRGIGKLNSLTFDGEYIWATSYTELTINKICIYTNSIMENIPCGICVGSVAFDGNKYMYVLTDTSPGLTKIDILNNESIYISNINNIVGIPMCIAYDGTHMWITYPFINAIAKIIA